MTIIDVLTRNAWKSRARQAIRYLAQTRSRFTSDDVWARLELFGERSINNPHARCMAQLLRAEEYGGLIRNTYTAVRSRRPRQKQALLTVYASMYFND